MATLRDVAKVLGLEWSVVRDVLNEVPGVKVARDVRDAIFEKARELGYDLKKLKIGKRLDHRREVLDELRNQLLANPNWDRQDVLRHIDTALDLIRRVQKRTFREEFSGRKEEPEEATS